MQFKIKNENTIETLTLIDPKSGCCWLADVIGDDSTISYNEDDGVRECTRETFDWWAKFACEYQAADERWHALLRDANNYKYDRMIEAASDAFNDDLENHPAILDNLCDQFVDKKYINTNDKFGVEGPYIAESVEALADEMMPALKSWAEENDNITVDALRAEFIKGLVEI